MQLNEFKIGQEFYCGGQRWRCTDIGTRVVVAICLEPSTMTRVRVTAGVVTEMTQHMTEEASRFNGPPYAVAETVFDEYDLPACTILPEENT